MVNYGHRLRGLWQRLVVHLLSIAASLDCLLSLRPKESNLVKEVVQAGCLWELLKEKKLLICIFSPRDGIRISTQSGQPKVTLLRPQATPIPTKRQHQHV